MDSQSRDSQSRGLARGQIGQSTGLRPDRSERPCVWKKPDRPERGQPDLVRCVVCVRLGPWHIYVRGHTTWTMGEDRGPEVRLDLRSVTRADLLVGLARRKDLVRPNTYSVAIVQTGVFRHHPYTRTLAHQIGAFDDDLARAQKLKLQCTPRTT